MIDTSGQQAPESSSWHGNNRQYMLSARTSCFRVRLGRLMNSPRQPRRVRTRGVHNVKAYILSATIAARCPRDPNPVMFCTVRRPFSPNTSPSREFNGGRFSRETGRPTGDLFRSRKRTAPHPRATTFLQLSLFHSRHTHRNEAQFRTLKTRDPA